MRAWIELDGETGGPARVRITELTNAGYSVDEYIRGDHCKDLVIGGQPPVRFSGASWDRAVLHRYSHTRSLWVLRPGPLRW